MINMNPFSKTAFYNGVRSEIEGDIKGSFIKMVKDPIEKAVVIGVTTAHPDPRINRMRLACDGCPYCQSDDTCSVRCESWYRYLLERRTYNNLPSDRRQEIERRFAEKQKKKTRK